MGLAVAHRATRSAGCMSRHKQPANRRVGLDPLTL